MRLENILKTSWCINQAGQSMLEILLAIGLTVLFIPALMGGFLVTKDSKLQESNTLQATSHLRELQEIVRSVREKDWSAFAALSGTGALHPDVAGTEWVLLPGPQNKKDYVRQVNIEDVMRDGSGNIVASGGVLDPSTKKVTYSVSWNNPEPGNMTTSDYFTRYMKNTASIQTAQSDFDSGVFVNTVSTSTGGGTVDLNTGTTGAGVCVDDYNNSSDYIFDPLKAEVAGGFAQLKNVGSPISGSTVNNGFNTDLNNWTFNRYGDNVSQTGTRITNGGNPGAYARINFPSNRNRTAGGYFYQAFEVTAENSTATLTFDWSVPGYQATPDSFVISAYIDSNNGAPVNQVWNSGEVRSSRAWTSQTVTVSAHITTPGTYYLKIAAFVDYPSSNRSYSAGFDNVVLNWSGTLANYPTDGPSVAEGSTITCAPANLVSWDSFTDTVEAQDGQVMYQLSDDGGLTWKYFDPGKQKWDPVINPTDYTSAADTDKWLRRFPVTAQGMKVKAFLKTNDSLYTVKLDKIVINYTGSIGGANNGTFTSSTIDLGSDAALNRISWTENLPVGTTVRFQVAINSDNTSWTDGNFFGPDGNTDSFFTNGGGTIPLNRSIGRYFRYRIFFTTSSPSNIPSVAEITVNFTP